jgi:7 transmembrane receptor (Secretin family)
VSFFLTLILRVSTSFLIDLRFFFKFFDRKLKRSNSHLVLLHLSASLLAVDVLIVGGIDRVDAPTAVCKTIAALLLYFLLVAFSWMLVEAIVQYLKFVKVFNTYTSRFMLKTALPAYSESKSAIGFTVLDKNMKSR